MSDQTRDEFYALPAREFSPEWDFGVMWRETPDKEWPLWRVSWIVNTGEIYAVSRDQYRLLGVVPAVGEYPNPKVGDSASLDKWHEFNRAQDIEKVMEGWASGEPHKPLSWVEARIHAWRNARAQAAL